MRPQRPLPLLIPSLPWQPGVEKTQAAKEVWVRAPSPSTRCGMRPSCQYGATSPATGSQKTGVPCPQPQWQGSVPKAFLHTQAATCALQMPTLQGLTLPSTAGFP